MRKYRRTNTLTSRGVYLRKRIAGNRSRAKFVGILYLLAIIALAGAACLPLLVHDLAPVGVMEFYKVFTSANVKSFKNAEVFTKLACAGLYALMLLGVVINVLRALGKLGWLYKKRASKTYGFNRNVYAMEDLGRIFSGSYAVILLTYFLIAALCDSTNVNNLMLIVLGGGAFLHLFLGFVGGKAGYYDLENGEVVEQRRLVGRFAPLFRNVLQLAAVFGVMYFFLKVNVLNVEIPALLQKNGISNLTGDMAKLITFAVQAVLVLILFVLVKHATAITEYNIDGANGPGMKNFRVFSFFAFLVAGAGVVYKYLFVKGKVLDKNLLIIAAIAFVIFFIEVIMRKMPRFPGDKRKKVKKGEEEEFTLDTLPQVRPQPEMQSF